MYAACTHWTTDKEMTMAKNTPEKFTKNYIKEMPVPEKGYRIFVEKPHTAYVPGFGVRTSPKGWEEFRFVFSYRNKAGRSKRSVIGRCNNWTVQAAREEAKNLRRKVDAGSDPVGEDKAAREAMTVDELFTEFDEEHLSARRKKTRRDYGIWYRRWIKKALGTRKLEEITYRDVRQLHQKITKLGKLTTANRVLSTLSSMYGFAKREGLFTGVNPCQGVRRNGEEPRDNPLPMADVAALSDALTNYNDQLVANIVRLLIFTGARCGETRSATWDQIDIEGGNWTKPSSHTKQNRAHRVPLSAPALKLLTEMRAEADPDEIHIFPGNQDGHRGDIQKQWQQICKAAGLVKKTVDGCKVHKYTIHDLRHTYGSTLASGGQSLPMIGALLGHTQAQTTQRYAHLYDDPLREAAETAGAVLSGKPSAEVINLNKRA
jgi:integrase